MLQIIDILSRQPELLHCLLLCNNRNAQLFCFFVFGGSAGDIVIDQVGGLLGNTAGYLTTGVFNRLLQGTAVFEMLQRTGDDKYQAGQILCLAVSLYRFQSDLLQQIVHGLIVLR